jgi:hypothetical protein
MAKKEATSYRLTPEAKRLLKALAAQLGLTDHAALEIAIRATAQRHGIGTDHNSKES